MRNASVLFRQLKSLCIPNKSNPTENIYEIQEEKHKISSTNFVNMSGPTQICPDCGLVHNGEHVFCPFFKGAPMPHAYRPKPGMDQRPQRPKPEERQGGADEKLTQNQRQRKPKEWEIAR